ncbi:hypothetical protein PR202_gb23735 [Eleusine coracana subsp. coracana]|uniref:Bidirectional sugar transporter SWEET n=1 Tax=Eleusine coracana subsp. coracana TaxID=191504 RepID=A0AAV5FL79_ELECO|nr:hypothetical protein PR202_gb23735 [Eleusine coracana subsp. coracana]
MAQRKRKRKKGWKEGSTSRLRSSRTLPFIALAAPKIILMEVGENHDQCTTSESLQLRTKAVEPMYYSLKPTFYRIYKSKSTEGFQSVPYVVALFSAMLWIFYALIKTGEDLLITINAAGIVIESIYIILYFVYAPKKAKLFTAKIMLGLNVGFFGLILLIALLIFKGDKRVVSLGWICVGFSVSVFVAPLSIILPNILGFTFGVVQMALYMFYMNKTPVAEGKEAGTKLPPESDEHIVNIAKLSPPSRRRVVRCTLSPRWASLVGTVVPWRHQRIETPSVSPTTALPSG